jgi:hypothetical protein
MDDRTLRERLRLFISRKCRRTDDKSLSGRLWLFAGMGLIYFSTHFLQKVILVLAFLTLIWPVSAIYLLATGQAELITATHAIRAVCLGTATVATCLLYRHLNPPLPKR